MLQHIDLFSLKFYLNELQLYLNNLTIFKQSMCDDIKVLDV